MVLDWFADKSRRIIKETYDFLLSTQMSCRGARFCGSARSVFSGSVSASTSNRKRWRQPRIPITEKRKHVFCFGSTAGLATSIRRDPKPNSSFKAISTNVAGIQVSELLPRVAKHMDKLSIVRSMRTEENNHGIAHHYAMTGHRPNPAMKFPSLGSIVANELGIRHEVPPYVMAPKIAPNYEEYFKAHMLGSEIRPHATPRPEW